MKKTLSAFLETLKGSHNYSAAFLKEGRARSYRSH